MKNIKELTIISDYLSANEIQLALKNQSIDLKMAPSQERTRGGVEPVIIAAIISGLIIGTPNWIANVITPIIRSLRDNNKKTKPDTIIELQDSKVKISMEIDVSDKDFEEQLELIKKLKELPEVFLTKKDE